MKDLEIGTMDFGGMDAEQLKVVVRLALNAEVEYDRCGRTELANQCMVLRKRAYDAHEALVEAEAMEEAEAHDPNDIRAMYPDDFSEAAQ